MSSLSLEEIQNRAIRWAEQYGIVQYRIKGTTMIYNVSYNGSLCENRYTVQHKVNLISMKEQKPVTLKRFDKKGYLNR